MTDNEITRLAERVESIFSNVPLSRMEQETKAIAAELRALARTDHAEDKLGMVPEGWGIEQHNVGYMVNPPDGPGCWVSSRDDFNVPLADQTLAKLCAAMLAASPAPDHSAGVGGAGSSRKRRVFVDMDGVIVDFDAYKIENNMTGDEVKRA